MIKCFLFDLGNVLFPFDIAKTIRYLRENCPRLGPDTLVTLKNLLEQYELGKMSSIAFFEAVKKETAYKGSFEVFQRQFSEIFTENPDAISTALLLKKSYPVYILSNTNEMHLEYIRKTFPFFTRFRGVFSYEAGAAKPDPQIFQIAIDRFSIEPKNTLFIDDKYENILAAKNLGFLTIHYILENGKPGFKLQDELTKFNISL